VIGHGKRKELYSETPSVLDQFGKIFVTDFIRDFWKDISGPRSPGFL
jgi:hypothetical protein